MKRFVVGSVINGLGLWLTTIVVPAIAMHPYGGTNEWFLILSYLLIGAIFGFVNAIVAPVIKVLAFPLYILTFGLISFAINGGILIFVTFLSNQIHGGGLSIDGFGASGLTWAAFGWAILGAIVMSVSSFFARWSFKILRIL
jgi:putative membrane protein